MVCFFSFTLGQTQKAARSFSQIAQQCLPIWKHTQLLYENTLLMHKATVRAWVFQRLRASICVCVCVKCRTTYTCTMFRLWNNWHRPLGHLLRTSAMLSTTSCQSISTHTYTHTLASNCERHIESSGERYHPATRCEWRRSNDEFAQNMYLLLLLGFNWKTDKANSTKHLSFNKQRKCREFHRELCPNELRLETF